VKFTKIIVLVKKINVEDCAPKITQVSEKKYESLDAFENDVQNLTKNIKEAIFSQ